MADAVETALDEHAAPPDAEEYAYAAGLTEPVDDPGGARARAAARGRVRAVEMAEPEASHRAEAVVPAEPEAPEPRTQEPEESRSPWRRNLPKAASEAPPVDIVTVVDDLLGGPPEAAGPKAGGQTSARSA